MHLPPSLSSLALTASSLLPTILSASTPQHPILSTPQLPAQLPIPHLGFGTWNLDRSNASDVVAVALKTGYRHIDCATAYGNEKEVGRGIREGLEREGVARGEVWVTGKLWNDHHAPDMVEKALDQTLEDLGLEYLDLYLMHWPVASSSSGNEIDYLDTWHAMTHLLSTHKVHHIGICNFSPAQLSHLLASTSHPPSVHQMELHPYLPQTDWLLYHAAHHIHVTAYSPLANTNPTYSAALAAALPNQKRRPPPPLLHNEVMREIARRRACSTAQVALTWGLSRGTSVIPKSAHEGRIRENWKAPQACVLEFEDFEDVAGLGTRWLTRFNDPSAGWGVRLYEGLEGV